jgi:hypothetical protein
MHARIQARGQCLHLGSIECASIGQAEKIAWTVIPIRGHLRRGMKVELE